MMDKDLIVESSHPKKSILGENNVSRVGILEM